MYQGILLAHWTLEGSAVDPNFVEDVTGNGFDGTSIAPAIYAPDKINNAAEIAADNYIIVEQVVDRPGLFTATAWVKTDTSGAILSLRDTLNGTFSCLEVEKGDNGSAGTLRYGQWDNDTWQGASTTEIVNDDLWHHVAMTYNEGEVVLYIDGLMQVAQTLTNNEYSASANEFLIASNEWVNYVFEGVLDDIRLYNYSMTKAQIAKLYLETEDYICVGKLEYDLNNDCAVDLQDIALLATQWLDCSQQYGNPNCPDVVLP